MDYNNTPTPVVKVDKLTREVVTKYDSVSQAAKAEGISTDHMLRRCDRNVLPRGRYYFRYADSFDPDEVFKGGRNCPVFIVDKKTGAKTWYSSQQEFLDKFEIKTVRVRIPMEQVKR